VELQFLFVSAIVPSLLLIWFFHARDLYPEPQRVVWATFGLGVLTILPALGVELAVDAGLKEIADPILEGWLQAFFSAAFTEESLKYAVVVFYCMRHKEFDEPMDGIVYGAIASLGFATLENCIYVGEGGGGTAILRALTAVPGHACMGAIMGYFVGQAKFVPAKRGANLAKAFFVPFLLHGLYDGPLLAFAHVAAHKRRGVDPFSVAGPFLVITFLALGFEVVWTLVLTSRLRRQQKEFMASQWAAYHARQPMPAPPWALATGGAAGAPRVFAPLAQAPYVAPQAPVKTEFAQPVVDPGFGQPNMNTRVGAQAPGYKTEVTPAPPIVQEPTLLAQQPWAPPAQAPPVPAQIVPAQKTQVLPIPPPQAPTAQTGYAPPGYAPPGYAPPGYAPPGYAQPGYVHPGPPLYPQHSPPDIVAWMMVGFGGLVASGAGLIVLGVIMLLLLPSTPYGQVASFILVGVVLGAGPLVAGLLLFAFGARRLARGSARPPPAFA
jgi:hypothetical protein